jgi:hypothetical protein
MIARSTGATVATPSGVTCEMVEDMSICHRATGCQGLCPAQPSPRLLVGKNDANAGHPHVNRVDRESMYPNGHPQR